MRLFKSPGPSAADRAALAAQFSRSEARLRAESLAALMVDDFGRAARAFNLAGAFMRAAGQIRRELQTEAAPVLPLFGSF